MFEKKKKMDYKETREEKFRRIASRRVRKIIEGIRLLENCSDKANYAYGDEQVKKIFSAINNELKIANALFNKSKNKKNKFKLD